jgi:hypothetical protein
MNRIRFKSAGTVDQQNAIPEPADGDPIIRGSANNADVPVCPGCDMVLMAGIRKEWARGVSLRCPMCYLVCTIA